MHIDTQAGAPTKKSDHPISNDNHYSDDNDVQNQGTIAVSTEKSIAKATHCI